MILSECHICRVKELGPEGGPPKKSVAVIDLDDDDMGKDQAKYKNAELAMLCTHSVS